MFEKVLPQNIDAEQSLLGAMILDREAIFKALKILRAQDFYQESHRLIYETIIQINEAGEAVDLVTLTEHLRKKGFLDKVGGASYLATIASLVPAKVNAEYYARIIEEKSLLRNIIWLADRIAGMSYEDTGDVERIISETDRMLRELSSRRIGSVFMPIKEVLSKALDYIEYLYNNKGKVGGVLTGFHDLDRICCGFQPSDLVILAGRPSMGKTSLGLCMAQQIALRSKIPVAIFSLEMSKEQIAQRMLCAEAMIDQQKLRKGMLSEEEWQKLMNTAARLSEAPIFIDDTAAISMQQMRAKARRLQTENGLGLLVVDYLQLIRGSERTENRQQEIAEISRALKALAKELNIPVLAISQLSRAVEQRPKKRPIMSDLRESGSLEQDADVVMFIYREEYYEPNSEKKGIAEVIIAKHRNGPVGSVELGFLKEFTRFVNLARS